EGHPLVVPDLLLCSSFVIVWYVLVHWHPVRVLYPAVALNVLLHRFSRVRIHPTLNRSPAVLFRADNQAGDTQHNRRVVVVQSINKVIVSPQREGVNESPRKCGVEVHVRATNRTHTTGPHAASRRSLPCSSRLPGKRRLVEPKALLPSPP
ncbi:hypothetical protein PFISCL1PPCAC_22410, partial [Pristionchus fissidentatus]